MSKIRILALDGGGMRGLIPATVLVEVEKRLQKLSKNPNARLADFFDLVVGTSTGGILSCIYLTPGEDMRPKYTAEEALEFYTRYGYDIFNRSAYRLMWARSLYKYTRYKPKNLEKNLKNTFGNLTFDQLLKPCVITTYNLNEKRSFFFRSHESKSKDRIFYVRDVARSTSAAPSYFPPARIKNLHRAQATMVNLDGGVFANNPALVAYAEARKMKTGRRNASAKDMLILSMGTGGGRFPMKHHSSAPGWNMITWAKTIPNIMMDGNADTVAYQIQEVFKTLDSPNHRNYKRIDVPIENDPLKGGVDMADASPAALKKLEAAAQRTLQAAEQSTAYQDDLNTFLSKLNNLGS